MIRRPGRLPEISVSSPTLLAVPIVSGAVPLDEQVRAAKAEGADLVELRVDCIADVAAVEALLLGPRILPMIVTVRTKEEGGAWSGDDDERATLIERLVRLQPGYVDVEYASWQRSANIRQRIGPLCVSEDMAVQSRGHATGRAAQGRGHATACAGGIGGQGEGRQNQLILSHHDLRETPEDLDAILDRLIASPAAIAKAVFTARDATDAFRVLMQLRRWHGRGFGRPWARKLIALAMGEAGLPTRVLARKFGAFLTFAALHSDEQSAPGQPTVGELRHVYRWDKIGPRTRVYGVVGWPVTHSLGPAVHNAALEAVNADGVYLPLPVGPSYADFVAFMDLVTREAELDVGGLSVTLPHKEHAFRWLHEHSQRISELAGYCGAANTLTRLSDGSWAGDNTDGLGAWAALQGSVGLMARGTWPEAESTYQNLGGQASGLSPDRPEVGPPDALVRRSKNQWPRLEVDVLGAGGVARAVAAVLCEHGCQVTIYNRTPERAEGLARELRCAWKPWAARCQYTGDVLINCTTLGLWPAVDQTPIPDDALRAGTLVFDTVYRPARTRLLSAAQARGCRIVSGVEMFVRQAAAQHELWHKSPAPIEIMRRALKEEGT